MSTRLLSALVFALTTAAPLHAQSLFNSAGMGLPIDALDGRARALGSLGLGLRGASFMPTDPAALAYFRIPTGIMASQPSWVEYTAPGDESGSFRGTRFPLMGLAYPLFSGMMSVQIGSFLDQEYTFELTSSVDLQGEAVPVLDRFEQDGAVSNLNLGYARMVGERISAGATLGRYAGSVVRTLTRSFEESTVEIEDYTERGKWSYAGYSVTAGVTADLSDIVRVSASVQLPTALDAEASDETGGGDASFDLPIQFRIGASGQLAPGLVIAVSGVLADWSAAADDLSEPATVRSANGFGVGLELSRARLLGKEAPLRFGYRRVGLPFSFPGGGAHESVLAGGLGLALNQTGDFQLAGLDLAMERGSRKGAGVTEDFWRMTISLVVSGF